MKEETKEEYLARIKKERGEIVSQQEFLDENELLNKKRTPFKEKFKGFLFILLFALFLWAVLQIFGMLKSN